MHRLYVLGLFFAMSFMSSVPRAHAADFPAVILSEIAWAGSAQSAADEWIELANIGTESIPLGGWQLTGVGTSDSVLTLPAETVLSAGSTYLISNYALGDLKSTLNTPSNLVTTAVSIPNTALNITLIDHNGATIDGLIDPGTPSAGSSAMFTSMERVLTDPSWASAETSTNLLSGQLGSPGVVGHALAMSVEVAPIEEAIIEDARPIVTEPVADPAPVIIEEPATETPDPVIDPVAIDEPTDLVVIDPVIETPIDEAPIEATPIESIVVPETIEIFIEDPAVTEMAPIEIAVIVETTPLEEPVVAPITSEAAETIVPETSVVALADESEATTQIATIHTGDIVISSVFPSPNTGDDEWVALTNTTDLAIDLTGITLVDASGAVTTLGERIEAQATLYVLNPKGKLNNSSDSVSLVDSAGTIIATAAYGTDEFPAPKKGTVLLFTPISESYEEPIITLSETTNATPATVAAPSDLATHSSGARTARTTALATTSTGIAATHSTPNIATRVASTSTTKSAPRASSARRSGRSRASTQASRSVSIDDIGSLADDSAVTLEGVVVSVPGTIGKRSFFLDGLEIYQSQGDLAAVSIGDHVRVTGTVSVLSDHRRVNIKAGGVTILGTSSPIVHEYSKASRYGSLARVTGTVSARDGNAVVLRIDNEHSITITPATGVTVNWGDLAGKTITVTGILKNSSTPGTIVLRAAEDIIVAQDTIEAAAAGTSSSSALPWVGAGVATLIAAGFGTWIWRNRPQSSLSQLTLHSNTI